MRIPDSGGEGLVEYEATWMFFRGLFLRIPDSGGEGVV